jgi:23S rRNA (uridine2552-2'-O)-methyltransferase
MSSGRWKDEHFSDYYVKKAHKEGYVCRAAFKLMEICEKFSLIKKNSVVVDLGAAPGGWCQVVSKLLNNAGRLVAVDLLPLKVTGITDFIQGDFTEEGCYQQLLERVGSHANVVLSDMAPNLTGIKTVDQARSVGLVELALDMALSILAPQGHFVAKVFQGSGVDQLIILMRKHFVKVKVFKPKSSRPRSSEVYLIGVGFKEI